METAFIRIGYVLGVIILGLLASILIAFIRTKEGKMKSPASFIRNITYLILGSFIWIFWSITIGYLALTSTDLG